MDVLNFKLNINNALVEEEVNLKTNLNIIDTKISHLKTNLDEYNNECNSYRGDYEFINEFREYKNKYNKTYEELKKIEEISNSPYFGHMYLYEKERDEDIFIGEHSITNTSGTNIIYDWRSPVCSLFYANQQSIKYNNYHYTVKYKRQIEIKHRKINKCLETYNENKDKIITDTFLKEILYEKKKQSGFTDIIKTIQAKQNEIIRNDINENIICQGVAGSGKTVILIHRISYLLFNNPQIKPEDFLFIAPNDNFKKELNELNKKLQIDKIKIITLYDYYIEKFNIFLNLNLYETRKYKINNIINDENIDIEKEYSVETLNNKYNVIEDNIIKYINELKFKYKINYNDNELSCIERGKKIYKFLSERISLYDQTMKKMKKEIQKLFENQLYFNNIGNQNDIKEITNQLSQQINANKFQLEEQLKDSKKQFNKLNNIIFKIFKIVDINEINSLKITITKTEFLINSYQTKMTTVNNIRKLYNSLISSKNYTENYKESIDKVMNFTKEFLQYLSVNIDKNDENENKKILDISVSIDEINKCINILTDINYAQDVDNHKHLYNCILPRNIINDCFEKICVGDYKLNTVFSKTEFYRIDIFTILYILEKLGYNTDRTYKYLYIDEAQDYNDVEIELIKKIENQSILNIFGDYRQNISNNSLLRKNWNTLKSIMKNNCKYYEMNENYRNTTNVVEYCNKTLELDMIGIGVEGENVKVNAFKNIDDVINRALITESIIITKNHNFLEYISKNTKVKGYDILSVKGLEFKNVIVIVDNFTQNEKYVAFTRSLGNLEIYEIEH